MKIIFSLLPIFVLLSTAYGQTQLVITSTLQTDRTFRKGDELLLENRATKNQIVFTLDTITKKVTTQKYLVETYYSVWDGDTTIKSQIKKRNKRWKHEIPKSNWEDILLALATDIDTLKKDISFLHTSHHYLNIHIDIITNSDTITYSKSKPFEYLTPWFDQDFRPILNPAIDLQIAELLPMKFIGRKELLLCLTTKPSFGIKNQE